MSIYDNNPKPSPSSAKNCTCEGQCTCINIKPFKPLSLELSTGEKILEEKLNKIMDNFYKLDDADIKCIDEILKKF